MSKRWTIIGLALMLFCLGGCRARHMVEASPQPQATVSPRATQLAESGTLSAPLTMQAARASHTATLLQDGRVLIVGGFRSEGSREVAIGSAELYDPASGAFEPTGSLNEPRNSHTATLLPTGEVLIVGGWGVNGRTATAELYNPLTGDFRYTASLSSPRASMTATALTDGRVVIIGGDSGRNHLQATTEIFDAATERFTVAASLLEGRLAHTATLLRDGAILVAGGSGANERVLDTAERYDPQADRFTPTGSLLAVRYKHAAVLLPSGEVMLIGGSDQRDWGGKYRTTELFDPASDRFRAGPLLSGERFKLASAALVLPSGEVLVGGGNQRIERLSAIEQGFATVESLDSEYFYTVLTLLPDDRVLITAGYDASITPSRKAWLYTP